jgi:hypothetical protein
MISLKGRLNSTHKYEKIHVLYYAMHWIIIGYILYYVGVRYVENDLKFIFSNYEIAYISLTLFFSYTTKNASLDYYNLNKIHKNTLDYYIGDLNPSRGSFLFNTGEKEEQIGFVFAILAFVIFVFCFIASIYNLTIENYKLMWIFLYNILLMTLSCLLGGGDINYNKVSSEKLNAIDNVEDLSEESKIKFREEVLKKLDKDDVIYKHDVLKICLELRKERIEMEKKEEYASEYEAFRKESYKKGVN